MAFRERDPGEAEHGVRHRDIEMSALAGEIAASQREQDVDDRRHGPARDVGRQRRRHAGRVGRSRRQREQAGQRPIVEIVTGFADARPALAVTADRADDQLRVDRAQCVISQSQPIHDARSELFDEDVGAFDERPQIAIASGVTRLSATHCLPPFSTAKGALSPSTKGGKPRMSSPPGRSMRMTWRRLGEHQRREQNRQQGGEVENADARQRLHGAAIAETGRPACTPSE